jgi:hypothetical protein
MAADAWPSRTRPSRARPHRRARYGPGRRLACRIRLLDRPPDGPTWWRPVRLPWWHGAFGRLGAVLWWLAVEAGRVVWTAFVLVLYLVVAAVVVGAVVAGALGLLP